MLDNNTAWIKKHQPKSIEEYVFQSDDYKSIILDWLRAEKISGNVLFTGPPGTGKTCLIEILIRSVIKTQSDLYRMKSRSVKEIDDLKDWIVKQPNRSKQNIVYIEEIDRLSKESFATLKDGMLEKYVETCVFLCATNHPKRINPALLSRFTYKFELNNFDEEGLFNRIKYILDNESAKYNENKLKEYVQNNKNSGLRDILNNLQLSYLKHNKEIIFDHFEKANENDEVVVELFLNIIKTILNITDSKNRQNCLKYPMSSIIASDYINFVTICNNNWNLDYVYIFEEIIERTNLYPLKNITIEYFEDLEDKKYAHLHMISCLYKNIEALSKMLL